MAVIKPFPCIRPAQGLTDRIAALPYDVYSRQEARAEVRREPLSFLNIDRPETQFGEEQDMYAPEVYEKAARLLRQWISQGKLVREKQPGYYVYELTMEGRIQTGLTACASIDDYLSGVIKEHEKTRADKEQDRIRHVDACSAQTGPIYLAYRKDPRLQSLLERAKEQSPLFDFTAEDGIRHRGWEILEPAVLEQIEGIFREIREIYIADGHHRAASAVKVGLKRRREHPDYDGTEEFNYFLSVLFPDEELKILPYNRAVKDLNGLSVPEFLEKLSERWVVEQLPKIEKASLMRETEGVQRSSEDSAEAGQEAAKRNGGDPENTGQEAVQRSSQVSQRKDWDREELRKGYLPIRKGQVSMYLKDQWYRLNLRPEYVSADPVEGLDVSLLQNHLLSPILGIGDPRRDQRLVFVGGIRGMEELERRVHTDCEAAFSMYPTSIGELFAVADAGRLMPPKSTWFEPKLRSGLFIHEIEA